MLFIMERYDVYVNIGAIFCFIFVQAISAYTYETFFNSYGRS